MIIILLEEIKAKIQQEVKNSLHVSNYNLYIDHDSLVKQIQNKNEEEKFGVESSWDSMKHTAKFKHSLNENYCNMYSDSNSKCESLTSKENKSILQKTVSDSKTFNFHNDILKDITHKVIDRKNIGTNKK